MLHVATLIAVLFVFHKKIFQLVRHPIENFKTNVSLIIATAITVGFVLIFNDWIESTFAARVLPITFIITAIVLFSISFIKKQGGEINYQSAAATGLAQGLAVIPGFSRSGFTISAAMASGVQKEKAAEFAFLMSIPIIVAALVWELIRHPISINSIGWLPLSIAFITALVSGIFAIKFMMDIIKRIKLYWFSLYLIVIAIIALFVV